MRMNLNLTKLAAAIGLLCSASFAHAQVYELSYTDPYSAVKVQKPSVKFINPASGLTVTAISGLDRKVRLELIKGTTVVQSQTSPLITVANRIVASDSNEFYGTKFTVSDPGDGNYILRSTILDISGVVVATTDYPLMLDRVAPTSNPIAVQDSTGYSQVSSGPEWKLGTGGSETPDILITGLSDSSGIASGKFVVYRESGAVYKSVALSYNASSNSFAYPKNSTFPSSNLDELFKLQFEVTDLAGNVYKTPLQGARWDNIANPPGVFGVYNPNTSSTLAPGLTGFDPYVSGMTVMTNPIRLAYRLARTNYAGYVQSGINLTNGVGEVTKVGEDADYVYLTMTTPFGFTDGNYVRWVNFGSWAGGYIDYNLVLSPSAAQTPVMSNVEYLYSDIGWASWNRWDVQNDLLPITITQERVTVQARPYDQKWYHHATCTIPAGQTSCTNNWTATMALGTTGYLHDGAMLTNVDGSLRGNPGWANVTWNDRHYPAIATEYDAATKSLKLMINQPGRGSYFDHLRLKDVWLEGNGVKVTPTGGKIAESGPDYTYQYNLASLPEGVYNNLAVFALEMHGPKTKVSLFDFTSDRTPPTLTMSYKGGAVPTGVETIKDLRVQIADTVDTHPQITRMTLKGGPINDALDLGFSQLADGYAPEVPRMFPTLEAGQSYTLKVDAQDSQGNKTSLTKVFSLSPQNMVSADPVNMMSVSKSLMDANDKPLALVKFRGSLTDGGSQSRGPQSGYITLRRDSNFSVMFNGTLIAPGETKDIVIPLDTAGEASLPVWPAEPGVNGKASYMIDIPQVVTVDE